MSMFEYTLRIDRLDNVYCIGVDFGGDLKLISFKKKYLLIKKSGKTVHLQRTDYTYSKPCYYIFKIIKIKKDFYTNLICEKVEEFEYNRQNKKQKWQEVLNKWEELNAKKD